MENVSNAGKSSDEAISSYRRSGVLSKRRPEGRLHGFLAETPPGQVPGSPRSRSAPLDQRPGPSRLGRQTGEGLLDKRLGQGRQNATAFLREHPDVCEGIVAKIQVELGPEQVASARLLPIAEGAEQNGKVDAKPEAVEKAAAKSR